MRNVLGKVIDYALSMGASFADVRVEVLRESWVRLDEGQVKYVASGYEQGANVRVIVGGAWGYSTSSSLSEGDLRKAVERAVAAAKALSEVAREKVKVVELPGKEDYVRAELKVNPADVDLEVKTADLTKLSDAAFSYSSSIKSVTVRYADMTLRKIYASSEGRYIEQEQSYTWLYVWVTGKEGDVMASAREELGSTAGYTIFEDRSPEELGRLVAERVVRQLHAKTPKGGAFPAVIAPNVVGVLVHEAFGHLAEADLALSGTALTGRLGEQVASELVTIVDDPTIPGGFGTFRYDDEGVEAVKVYLVRDGVLTGLMHSRETAASMGAKPTGNARAESYRYKPIVRMRNTVLEPGDYRLEELFEGIEFGYYLKSFRGGQANLDGTFQVGVQEAYEIIKGEVGEPVRNMSISGNALETLKLVEAVGRDFDVEYGRCGKGQTVFVCSGGPHIRVKRIVIGGEA